MLNVIDISPLLVDDADIMIQEQLQVAQQIDASCKQTGFMYITGYQSKFPLLSQFKSLVQDYFLTATREQKQSIAMYNQQLENHHRGFFSFGDENVQDVPQPDTGYSVFDMKEGIDFGIDFTGTTAKHEFQSKNVYPNEQWHSIVNYYLQAMITIGHAMNKGFALALQLPSNYFDDMFTEPLALLRALHYPAPTSYGKLVQEFKIKNDKTELLGCGAHTDYGWLTMLDQDNVGGLQMHYKNETWVNMPYIENTMVVNFGDAMQIMTNNMYRATTHRVVINPQETRDRFSFPFFWEPNYETPMQVLPTCMTQVSNATSSTFACYGQYFASRLNATFTKRQD